MQKVTRRKFDCRNGEARILKVGIVGCGRIAAHHLRFIHRTEGVRVVALSDPILANAQRFAEQYGVERIYTSHFEMLDSTALDVVHVLTPPEFHYRQALDVIDRGVHVLLEKPCTIYPYELEDLYRRAEAKRVSLCPDFIQLFNPVFLEAAALVDSGELGDVIHMDGHLSVDLNSPELRESIGLPWRFKLPGGILHDNITHPLYMTLRWLGEPVRVSVCSRSNGVLPQGLTDCLTVMLEGEQCTANLVISAVVKPEPYYLHVFCEHGHVLVDFDTSTVLVNRASALPPFVRRATANFMKGYKLLSSGVRNSVRFACGRLVPYQGLEILISRFYDCVRNGAEVPVLRELALAVARTETEIFSKASKLHLEVKHRPSSQKAITRAEKILVTGATGYLGSVVVQHLVEAGYRVRALVRELSRTEGLEALGVELVYGDIRNPECCTEACKGMDIVIHMAAALKGTPQFVLDSAVRGTQNIAYAAKTSGLNQLVYISSMSVYDCVTPRNGETINENSPLEELPQLRGVYSLAKRGAEDEALSHLLDGRPMWTILRPSVIVGEHYNVFAPIGQRVGSLVFCAGRKNKMLRLIHVADVADAIVKSIGNSGTWGRIFNLSDHEMSQQDYVDKFVRTIGDRNFHVVYVPYWVARLVVSVIGALRIFSKGIPYVHKRRLASLYRSVKVNSDSMTTATGWKPRKKILVETQTAIITPSSSFGAIESSNRRQASTVSGVETTFESRR